MSDGCRVALAAVLGASAACTWAERVAVDLFGPPDVEAREVHPEAGRSVHWEEWDRLLGQIVDGAGRVDYGRLRRVHESDLNRVLTRFREVELDGLRRDHRLATLINAYNAFTLQLVLDHWPVDSIRDIPSKDRWKAKRWQLGSRTVSLHELEHEMLRRNFVEPRIHFAINCASESCPPLLARAYDGDRVDAQLDRVSRMVHTPGSRWFRFERDGDSAKVRLTRIYLWYEDDFEAVAESAEAFASRFSTPLERALNEGARLDVGYLDYDWSLNRTRTATPSGTSLSPR
jgi:hypothetical protein